MDDGTRDTTARWTALAGALLLGGAMMLAATARAACPDTSLPVIAAPAGTTAYSVSPQRASIIDMSARPVTVGSQDGIDVNSPYAGTCVDHARVVSTVSRDMGWDQRHTLSGDAIHWSHAETHPGPAPFVVTDFFTDNAEDSIGPPKGCSTAPEGTSFLVRRGYSVYNRDDFIEDDGYMNGEIDDVLVDSTHMFLSQTQDSQCTRTLRNVYIHDSLVHIACMPDGRTDKSAGGCPLSANGLRQTTGQLWKRETWSGALHVKNLIALIDGTPASGLRDMDFPSAGTGSTYENVIIVWAGVGPYPRPVPAGVTVTTDHTVWDNARAAWLAAHSDLAPAAAGEGGRGAAPRGAGRGGDDGGRGRDQPQARRGGRESRGGEEPRGAAAGRAEGGGGEEPQGKVGGGQVGAPAGPDDGEGMTGEREDRPPRFP